MERMQSKERVRVAEPVPEDAAGQLLVTGSMVAFLIGLACLFLVAAPH